MSKLIVVSAAALLFAVAASAQEFPSRSVRLIVPFPPSGAVDIIGRTMGPPLSQIGRAHV